MHKLRESDLEEVLRNMEFRSFRAFQLKILLGSAEGETDGELDVEEINVLTIFMDFSLRVC